MTRAEENLLRKYEAADRRRLAAASEQIAADSDLRFFIITALESCGGIENSGMGTNPHATNALTTAHETGKMAAMQYLISLISTHVPTFYPDLIKEALNERTERTASIAALGSADE